MWIIDSTFTTLSWSGDKYWDLEGIYIKVVRRIENSRPATGCFYDSGYGEDDGDDTGCYYVGDKSSITQYSEKCYTILRQVLRREMGKGQTAQSVCKISCESIRNLILDGGGFNVLIKNIGEENQEIIRNPSKCIRYQFKQYY
jgi:hypothetical protein